MRKVEVQPAPRIRRSICCILEDWCVVLGWCFMEGEMGWKSNG